MYLNISLNPIVSAMYVLQGIMSATLGDNTLYHCVKCNSVVGVSLEKARKHMVEHNRLV